MISSVCALSLCWNWTAFCRPLIRRTFECSHLGSFLQFTFSSTDANCLSFLPIIIFQALSKAHWALLSCLLTRSLMIKLWFWFSFSEIFFSLQHEFLCYCSNPFQLKSYLSLSITSARAQITLAWCSEYVIQGASSRPCFFNEFKTMLIPFSALYRSPCLYMYSYLSFLTSIFSVCH